MGSESSQTESLERHVVQFTTTRWSVVLAAGDSYSPESRDALEQLCRSYWYPLYAFVRKSGHAKPDAEDLVQEFFARLLEKRYVTMADPARGRFRSFLLSAFRHFLANEWDRRTAAKRGGRNAFLSWDELGPESRYAADGRDQLSPDEIYERSWALSVLGDVRARLRAGAAANGKADHFDLLESFLPGAAAGMTYDQLAARWGVKEVTVRTEVHHLRRRYAARLRETVADLVANPQEAEDELRALIAAVST